jgi:hypothetical protein
MMMGVSANAIFMGSISSSIANRNIVNLFIAFPFISIPPLFLKFGYGFLDRERMNTKCLRSRFYKQFALMK